jgi:imidazole glycerol phosphate synthase glutamine amidotransferase subunit
VIALLDYGGGNVGSVLKAIEYLGYSAARVDRPEGLAAAEKVIFPGQGHFGQMMKALAERGLLDPLRGVVAEGKPFLGICLGLQVLYGASDEAPGVAGLGILPGRVTRFTGIFKVPHLGWSQLQVRRSDGVLKSVPDGSFVYYCHSYYGPVVDNAVALTEYGQTFAAAVEKGNAWAVQFHPEKSGAVGLRVIRNFLES